MLNIPSFLFNSRWFYWTVFSDIHHTQLVSYATFSHHPSFPFLWLTIHSTKCIKASPTEIETILDPLKHVYFINENVQRLGLIGSHIFGQQKLLCGVIKSSGVGQNPRSSSNYAIKQIPLHSYLDAACFLAKFGGISSPSISPTTDDLLKTAPVVQEV